MNNVVKYEINLNSMFPVTLLVPERLYPFLQSRLENCKKKNKYLRNLLEKFSNRESLFVNRHMKPTSSYQEKNQNLVRFDFKTQGVDWFKLKIMALECGLSMSALFVFMLRMDMEFEIDLDTQVPTFTAKLNITTFPYSARLMIKYPKIPQFASEFFKGRVIPCNKPPSRLLLTYNK